MFSARTQGTLFVFCSNCWSVSPSTNSIAMNNVPSSVAAVVVNRDGVRVVQRRGDLGFLRKRCSKPGSFSLLYFGFSTFNATMRSSGDCRAL